MKVYLVMTNVPPSIEVWVQSSTACSFLILHQAHNLTSKGGVIKKNPCFRSHGSKKTYLIVVDTHPARPPGERTSQGLVHHELVKNDCYSINLSLSLSLEILVSQDTTHTQKKMSDTLHCCLYLHQSLNLFCVCAERRQTKKADRPGQAKY